MRLNTVTAIFKKEILDTLRDRRTLLFMIVIPVLLYPAIMIFVNELATSQQARMEQKTISLAVINSSETSPIWRRLESGDRIKIVATKTPMEDVAAGKIDFVVELPPKAESLLEQGKTARVKLYYDRSNEDAVTNLERVRGNVESYSTELLQGRLKQKAIDKQFIEPLVVDEVNVATKQRMGGFLIGRFLPMLMVIMVLVGSMYPAIDMTAGEKERGTLETILTSPATSTEIVAGKFLAVTLIALLTGLLNLGSMIGTFAFGIFKSAASQIQINIPLNFLFVMISCLVPLAIFFSGIMMAVATFARSFKEAQNMLTPVYLVATLPAMISFIPGIQLGGFWLTIPVANVTLLFKELMLGVFSWNHVLFVFLSVVFLASAALYLAIKLFGREEVLFGEASSFGLSLKRSNIVAKPVPDQPEALFFCILSFALLLYVAIPLQMRSLISGLVLTELVVFLLFPLAFAVYLKLDFRQTFRLRPPSIVAIFFTVLLAAGIQLAAGTILYLQNLIFPIPKELIDSMERMLKSAQDYSFPAAFAVIALLPAICEEVTFRGMILSGLLTRSKPSVAITITAALFAVFHLSIHRFFPVFLVGLAASFVVWRSGSIFPGMLLHLINNGLITFLAAYPQYDSLGLTAMKPSAGLFVAGAALVLFSIWGFHFQKGIKEGT
jgi:sodium transport system permease protein